MNNQRKHIFYQSLFTINEATLLVTLVSIIGFIITSWSCKATGHFGYDFLCHLAHLARYGHVLLLQLYF